jgi:hypothetical protein
VIHSARFIRTRRQATRDHEEAEMRNTNELDRTVAQRDALFALADATAELLSRSSVAAGEMLRSQAVRCLHAPEAELVSLARREQAHEALRHAA